ncbi:hypothetical protein R1sor_004727 [Riccia sorocarpa]|uniref:Reverse transcriptase n=1 Tax=Riccia sorocarpa TaxID=122646 RepID=A0ABD3HLT3_9MARC
MNLRLRVAYPIFKGKRHEDPDLHIASFEQTMNINGENAVHKARLFLATLKQSAFAWYSQLDPQTQTDWDDVRTEFLEQFRVAQKDPDIMYQIQKMKQQEKETIKEFLTRFRMMIRRLEVPPTDAQKIMWLRNVVHQRFITSVEDRGYANADDFEDKLKTCAYSMAYRDGAFSNERDAYRRTDQDSEDEHSDDSSGTKMKKRYLREQQTEQKLVNHWKKVLSSIGKDRAHQSTPAPMRYCHICNNNSHDTRVCYYNAKNSQTRKGRDVPVHAIEGVKETPVREEPRRNYPRQNYGEGSSQQQTSQLKCYYCYEKGHIKRNCTLFKKHMDERRTSKTPHVAGSNAIYVELKDNTSVSVMTREMRRQAPELDVIPDSIPDDDLTPLRRWDKEDQVTKDTIDFIQEMQTSDEQEDVEVGNEGDYFPFSNREPPEDDPNPVNTAIPENVWKKNRRRTEDEPSNPGKRVRFTIEIEEPQAVEEIAKKLTEKFLQQKAEITMQELFNLAPYCKELMLRRLMVMTKSVPDDNIPDEGVPDDHLPKGNSIPDDKNIPDGTDSQPDVGVASIAPWMDIGPVLQIQVKGMRLPNIFIDGGSGANEWDLTKNFVELVWREERRRISTVPRCIPNKASIQPIEVCTLNWEDGLSEEEEMMLQWAMPSLWTIAEIDIEPMEPTSSPDLQQGETSRRQVQFNESTIVPEKEEAKPLVQRPYRMNPNYAETVKKEIEKLKEADFIYPVKEYNWLSPIVIVPKKNGKLRVCVDYRKLNEFTVKDPYPIPFTDDILDKVAGREAYTFMDGYSGYNQVEIAPEDRKKTAFITPWGAYAYARMPFGLSNAPATFQRLVIDTFAEYIGDFMEAFLDDFTVYGSADQHLQQLEKALIKCLENQIRLNPEKCVFWVQSGVLLGHIICSEGILMDPGKVEKIRKQLAPTNRKELQRVMGMANFYRRYILNYAVLAALVNALNKENVVFKWTHQCQEAFDLLKEKLSQGPIFRPPNWNMIFHVHTDASGVVVGAVLAQPQDPKIDLPIYFVSRTLNNSEKDYTTTEREALAMVYAVKKFNKFVFFVDHQALTYIVNKVHITGRIARWLLLLHEFDFTVVYKPGKINILADQLSRIEMGREIEHEDDSFPDEYLLNINMEKPDTCVSSGDEIDDSRGEETYEGLLKGGWQTPMRYLLTKGSLPEDTPYHIKKKMAQKSAQYTLIESELYKQGIDQVLRRCVNEEDVSWILEEAHEDPSGGHGAGEANAQKILHTGLWWPTIFKDCHSHVRTCNECQRSATLKECMPLKPIFSLGVFQKWDLDFINGPIKPASFPTGKRYIITATDYTTKWVEAECYRTNDKKVTAKFIYENIITRFGVPVELVSDQGGHFLNGVIEELTTHYQVKHRFSTPYYPQCNGQAESTNKILIVALRKLVERHPVNWDASVPSVLWAMRTAYKATTNHTPFHMIYVVEALVSMEFIVPILRIATEYNLNLEEMLQRRLKELLQLEESREQTFAHQCSVQERRKRYVDKRRKMFNFKKDDKVLYCVATGKIKRRKLKYIWEGPYIVQTVLDNGNICIVNDDKSFIQIVNGNKLRPYGVNKFARGDPFVEQVEDILRDMEATAEEYYPDVADDYRIELTPKERNLEGEEIRSNKNEIIGNRARRWREAKQAKQTFLLEKSRYRIGAPTTSKYLNKYPEERNPLEWKKPKDEKRRMNDVRRMYRRKASKALYAWKDYALSLERMRHSFTYNPKGKEKVSNQDVYYDNVLSKETSEARRKSLWEKYYYGTGEPSTSGYPDVDLYSISLTDLIIPEKEEKPQDDYSLAVDVFSSKMDVDENFTTMSSLYTDQEKESKMRPEPVNYHLEILPEILMEWKHDPVLLPDRRNPMIKLSGIYWNVNDRQMGCEKGVTIDRGDNLRREFKPLRELQKAGEQPLREFALWEDSDQNGGSTEFVSWWRRGRRNPQAATYDFRVGRVSGVRTAIRTGAMGRKGGSTKEDSQITDTEQGSELLVPGDKEIPGQKTFACYKKELDPIDWEDEE